MMMKAAQALYSEVEVAALLGISVGDLRNLVRVHIVKDGEVADGPSSYKSSDLVMLRIFAKMTPAQAQIA